ncbi:uncharacterized protein [Diabrotica undecimpunctata]|uniref:uncharacterized protein n=1 Tax=Diabrotica undecimpunctata TaxID=50387 RepID=UPI003B639176
MVNLALQYMRLATKRCTLKLDIWFISQCINYKVFPTFCRIKTPGNVPTTLRNTFQLKILKKEICNHYGKLNFLNCKLKVTYDFLLESIGFDNLSNLLNDVQDKMDSVTSIKFSKLKSKLNKLINNASNSQNNNSNKNKTKFSNFQFHPRLKNLSSVTFDKNELDLLNLGLKYSIPRKVSEKDLQSLSIELDVIIQNLSVPLNQKTSIRNSCYKTIFKFKNKNFPSTSTSFNISTTNTTSNTSHNSSSINLPSTSQNYSFNVPFPQFSYKKQKDQLHILKSIQNKIKSHNLIISKADKGNCLVILDQKLYNDKVTTFLSDNNFTPLPEDPTKKFINKIKATNKLFTEFLSEHDAPYYKIPSNPLTPRLYGLPKIHKEGIPIRPVVSFINTPVSILSKFILNLINNMTNFTPRFSVKNTIHLVNNLQQINLHPNITMLSFDVSNLFTSVPKQETINLVHSLLRANSITMSTTNSIIQLLQTCLAQDFFVFNSKFYRQPDGLAMGSCLSPLLADIFMDHLESTHIMKNPEILHWFRYVDDCLVFISGNSNSADLLLSKINQIHPNIKFTMELESSQSINFLDLTITRLNDHFDFSIYRKPTQTDHIIPLSSNHPMSHKYAAFHSYIHRLETIPLSQSNYQTELNILKQIASNNGYDPNLINKLINKRQLKLLREAAFPRDLTIKPHYASLPYLQERLSGDIRYILKRSVENTHISFKVLNNLGQCLTNSKDCINYMDRSGVYKLQCSDCDATYIGRTCRSLTSRSQEHTKKENTSTFSQHLAQHKHTLNIPEDVSLLHNIPQKNFLKLDLYEDLEIVKEKQRSPNCVNRHVSFNRDFQPLHRQLFS